MSKIYYTKPLIGELEHEYVNDAVRNGWGEKCYEYIYRFEREFAAYIGTKYAIATSSCTGALHMILSAIGISLNDEVIMPDITWIATASPITYLGAKPVFVDVLEDTWCINPELIERKITEKTKAIIVVHVYGNLVDMDKVLKIAEKHNLPVIEDAAEGLGSEWMGKRAGSIGDFGVFSFHGTKTLTTGEGGMLVTNNKKNYEKLLVLANHGRPLNSSKQFWCEEIGYKYKMTNLQAALGCAQMQHIDDLVERKRQIFFKYNELLGNIKGIKMNPEYNETKNAFWMPTLIFDDSLNVKREELLSFMQKKNIDARVFFYPISMFPMFEDQPENIVSYRIYKNSVNLPSFFEITDEQIQYICQIIKTFINR